MTFPLGPLTVNSTIFSNRRSPENLIKNTTICSSTKVSALSFIMARPTFVTSLPIGSTLGLRSAPLFRIYMTSKAYDVVSGRHVALDPPNFTKYCDSYQIPFVPYVSNKPPAASPPAVASAALVPPTPSGPLQMPESRAIKLPLLLLRPLMGFPLKQRPIIPRCPLFQPLRLKPSWPLKPPPLHCRAAQLLSMPLALVSLEPPLNKTFSAESWLLAHQISWYGTWHFLPLAISVTNSQYTYIFTLSLRQKVLPGNTYFVDPSCFEWRGSLPGHPVATICFGDGHLNLTDGQVTLVRFPCPVPRATPPRVSSSDPLGWNLLPVAGTHFFRTLTWLPGRLPHQRLSISQWLPCRKGTLLPLGYLRPVKRSSEKAWRPSHLQSFFKLLGLTTATFCLHTALLLWQVFNGTIFSWYAMPVLLLLLAP